MNPQNNQDVKEFAGLKTVIVNCKKCDNTIGDFREFKPTSSRKNWAADLNNMDWNIQFKIENDKISCDCGNELGKMTSATDVLFNRKSTNLKY